MAGHILPAPAQHFVDLLGIDIPVIGGPMYPCSNPELVAAVSAAGGLGIMQPISLTYVYGHEFREGIRLMRKLTDRPIGMNALIEKSSKKYQERMSEWIDIALEEGIRFFVTSLGKPDWVAERVHAFGGLVYHDVTELKWAEIGLDNGADGLICVNNRAGALRFSAIPRCSAGLCRWYRRLEWLTGSAEYGLFGLPAWYQIHCQ